MIVILTFFDGIILYTQSNTTHNRLFIKTEADE